jgi:hypothetical protein
MQKAYKIHSDIEILARCTPAKVKEGSEWTTIVNSAEENRANFCKTLNGKPLFSTHYSMYIRWLHRQDRVVQWTIAQDDDFQEVKRHKRYISNDTLQTAKKSTKPIWTSTAVKLPPKAVLTHNLFAPLRTTDLQISARLGGGAHISPL